MSSITLAGVCDALRAGDLNVVLGLHECGWLDVKSGIYNLNAPSGADEFVKDVASFANTATGGVLLIGYTTCLEAGLEVIEGLRPVPRNLVDLDQHRKLI